MTLVLFGIVMLASTSGVHGEAQHGDPTFFLKRQVAAVAVGFIAAYLAARIDYHLWQSLAVPILLATMALLVLVLIPGVGTTVKGSARWLSLGFLTLQPSELGKLAAILALAWWMSRVQMNAESIVRGLLIPLLLLGLLSGLIFVEPDFGTTMLIGLVGMAVMFVGGTRTSYLVVAAVLGFSAISVAIMEDAERMRRIIAFLNPEKYAKDEAFQLLSSIYAFVVGGAGGVGLGESLQKRFYLPEAHTDFIFAIIGEELGFIASLGVVALFLGFLYCGLRVSFRASDSFGRLVAFGITSMITMQAAINIGVVTGCLPTKGLPLPFISFGGTSMVVTLVMVGILINIALQAGSERGDESIPSIKNKARRI
jgi:cell division protein FtsW